MVRNQCPIEWHPTCGIESDFAYKLWGEGLHPYVYDIHLNVAFPDAAAEMVFVTGTVTCCNIQFGGTRQTVAVLSAGISDASSATGHCRKVKIWGVDRYDNYRIEEIALSGTTSTSFTNTYKAVNTMWGSLFGTGGEDALGNIHLAKTGKVTHEILEITANNCISHSARTYIPKNWRCKVDKIQMSIHQLAAVADSKNYYIGGSIYPRYDDRDIAATTTSEDIVETWGIRGSGSTVVSFKPIGRVYGADNTLTKLSFFHTNANTDNDTNIYTGIRLLLWPTRHLATSQNSSIVGLP